MTRKQLQPASAAGCRWLCAVLSVCGVGARTVTAYFEDGSRGSLTLDETKDFDDGAAVATYDHEEGWSKIWVYALPNVDDDLAMYAAGYLEGFLMADKIKAAFENAYWDWFSGDQADKTNASAVYVWLQENDAWMRQQVAEHAKMASSPPLWRHVSLLLAQLDGLAAGLAGAGSSLKYMDVVLLQADGDLEELVPHLAPKHKRLRSRDRCSALIKLAPDNADIFFGHATFDHYGMMVRSLKSYDIRLRSDLRTAVTLSSSPGFISSIDDFFLTSHGLAVIETTNGVKDHSLYSRIVPETLLSWVRASVANALAKTTAEWADLFSTANSGTYNNQWMVLDLKLFRKGQPLQQGLFVVLEQIPGYIEWQDKTAKLQEDGYWGSYNVPYFKKVLEISGYDAREHHTAPRANIFRERQHAVANLEDFQRLLRYNNWEHDPLSLGDACNAISSRCDLNPASSSSWQLDGGIDAKAASVDMGKALMFAAQNGPTTYQQPAFRWADVPFEKQPLRRGQPEAFDFQWVSFSPQKQPASLVDWTTRAVIVLMLSMAFVAAMKIISRLSAQKTDADMAYKVLDA
eukprot:TRINITY_DN26506_c0_g1_i1.p1 TRINITY_DN26506_c0_g1~~TRINITY_DN26506_c0_g1_i1.p1  ORF type:complete len:574 (+),score=131.43 TRINITY_DN26506_c0_g1_i1:76-1797(+)